MYIVKYFALLEKEKTRYIIFLFVSKLLLPFQAKSCTCCYKKENYKC